MPLTLGYCVCVAAALALVVSLETSGAAPHEAPSGIEGPGALTGWGVPGSRLVSDLAGVVAVGAVLAATTLVPREHPQLRGRFLSIAGAAALVLALSACAGLAFHASELLGRPVTAALRDGSAVLDAVESAQGRALVGQLLLAVVVALGARAESSTDRPYDGQVRPIALLGTALAAMAVPTVGGHAATDDERWLATTSVLVHAAGASLWVGGLVALGILVMLVPADDGAPAALLEPVGRFSALALVCLLAVAASGVVNAWVRLDELQALWRSDYGRLILVKVAALALLALIGWAHRLHTIRALATSAAAAHPVASRRPFLRLAGVEVAVMAATLGVAVGLAHTPTPGNAADPSSAHVSGHGDMDGMPGMAGMDMSELNDRSATPAYQLRNARLQSGPFAVLATAPPGSEGVEGRAWLGQDGAGTTVTIRLRGLVPGETYVAHLHEQTCRRDNAGAHFAFDPDGPEVPPNEIHLGFVASAAGTGQATVTNDRRVSRAAAPAVVVHPAQATDNRLACADF